MPTEIFSAAVNTTAKDKTNICLEVIQATLL